MNRQKHAGVSRAWTAKRFVVRGDFSARALGDMQGTKRRVAKHVCRNHTWIRAKWSRRCSVCGLVEDR